MRRGRPSTVRTSRAINDVTVDLLRSGEGDPNLSTLHERLTAMQLLLAQGVPRKEIAERMDVTRRTVERYSKMLKNEGVLG